MGISLFKILTGHKPKISASSSYASESTSESEYILDLQYNYKQDIVNIKNLKFTIKIQDILIRMINPLDINIRPSAQDLIELFKPKIDT